MIWNYLRKEFRLQRTNHYFALLALAVELLLWILAGDGLRVIAAPNYVLGELVQGIHYGILGITFLLLIPFFSGIAAGVGDRDAGVADWCMSLPAPKWKQWLLKGLVAIVTACVFAGLYVVAGVVVGARLDAQGIESILGANRETFETLSWRGISPIWYMPWFVTLGMFAGSVTRSYYRAFAVAVPVGAVAAFAPFLMDPMGLTFAFPALRPGMFEKPWIHIVHLLGLAAAAMALGLRNYGFELPRLRRVFSGAILWVLIANVAAIAVIWKELRIPDAEFRGIASVNRADVKGVELLFHHHRIGGINSMVRVPKSNCIAMLASLDAPEGGKVYNDKSIKHVYRPLLFEVDVATGALTQYPNAAGEISGMDRQGRFMVLSDFFVAMRGTPFFLVARKRVGGEPLPWMRWSLPDREPEPAGGTHVVELDGKPLPHLYAFHFMSRIAGDKLRVAQIQLKNGSRVGLVRDDGENKATVIDLFGMEAPSENSKDLLAGVRTNPMMNHPPGYYCVSPDEKWFAACGYPLYDEVGYSNLPMMIKSTDGATSYRLGLEKPLYPMVGLQTNSAFLNNYDNSGGSLRDLLVPHPTQLLLISPSGRYLAYYGWGQEGVRMGSTINALETLFTHGVLDLTTGEKKALIEGSWIYTEPSPVRPNWIQYLPMAWSKDGILACLTKDGLSFFREDAESGELRPAGELDLKPMWPMVMGTIQAPMFWDEDTLLLFGGQSLWKVELREAMPGLFNGN